MTEQSSEFNAHTLFWCRKERREVLYEETNMRRDWSMWCYVPWAEEAGTAASRPSRPSRARLQQTEMRPLMAAAPRLHTITTLATWSGRNAQHGWPREQQHRGSVQAQGWALPSLPCVHLAWLASPEFYIALALNFSHPSFTVRQLLLANIKTLWTCFIISNYEKTMTGQQNPVWRTWHKGQQQPPSAACRGQLVGSGERASASESVGPPPRVAGGRCRGAARRPAKAMETSKILAAEAPSLYSHVVITYR